TRKCSSGGVASRSSAATTQTFHPAPARSRATTSRRCGRVPMIFGRYKMMDRETAIALARLVQELTNTMPTIDAIEVVQGLNRRHASVPDRVQHFLDGVAELVRPPSPRPRLTLIKGGRA